MCDAGHVTLQLIHDNPKKKCFIQAGSIEIDFILEEIHIYHCPCDIECGSIECCNKCDRKKYRYPNIERAVHRCTTPISKIKVVSSDCFKNDVPSPDDSSCNEQASYDPCDAFSESYTNSTIIECSEVGSRGKVCPKMYDEEFILKLHRRCSEQQLRRQQPESSKTKKCYDQQNSTRKCSEIEIPKSRSCREKQNTVVYQKKWSEKQIPAICPRDRCEKKTDAISPKRCIDNQIVAVKTRCKEQQPKVVPKRVCNEDVKTDESAKKCSELFSNRRFKKCPNIRDSSGECINPLRRVNKPTDKWKCEDTCGTQERKMSRKCSLDIHPKKCFPEKMSRTRSDLCSDSSVQKLQKCLSERDSPTTKKMSCSKIIECKLPEYSCKRKNNSVPQSIWNGKRESKFEEQNHSSDQTNCDVEIVSCSTTCNTDEMDILASLGNCIAEPSFIKCDELIVDCDSKNILATCCDFRDCDSSEDVEEFLECSD